VLPNGDTLHLFLLLEMRFDLDRHLGRESNIANPAGEGFAKAGSRCSSQQPRRRMTG
jgi:hypothetical protein